ncbi:MAG: GNAT family N-acetyltransferase, partial [Actinomycetota bacterium]|nr:GNAT family N-acetyltransferase [Actinomycetota bacterium]
MAGVPAGYTIEEFDFEHLPESDVDALLALSNRVGAEREHRHRPLTREDLLVFVNMPGEVQKRFMIRDNSGVPVAQMSAGHADDGSNPHLLRVRLMVDADHRRCGLATALIAEAVAIAESQNRDSLTGIVFDTMEAGGAFLAAIGGERQVEHQQNLLSLKDLDTDLLHGWVDDGPSRAPGYSVQLVEGAYPEEILDQMAHLYFVLERDMPAPEGQDPRQRTGAEVAEFIAHFLRGGEILTAIAFGDETGEATGMSQLFRRHSDHETWLVTTTMVDPAHRGHALGKWVKAAVNLEALEKWPGGRYEETGNAEG